MPTINALAHSYIQDPDLILSDHDRADLIRFVAHEYKRLIQSGLNVVLCDDDPYSSFGEMLADYQHNFRLRVYTGGTSSPLLSDQLNIMFRAVHDAHHLMIGADFTMEGEIQAFKHAASLVHNSTLRKLFFSEIVLQAATFYATDAFPQQRIVDSPLISHYLTRG